MPEITTHPNRLNTVSDPALRDARKVLYEIAEATDDTLESEQKNLDSVSPLTYWLRAVEIGNQIVRSEYASIDKMQLGAAIELTAAIPYNFMAQHCMNKAEVTNQPLPRDKFEQYLYFASYFNSLIRNYAWFNPELQASDLNQHLIDVIRQADIVKHPERFQRMFADTIRGAQHEVAFAPVLQAIGEIRATSQAEDLQGADYVLRDPEKPRLGIPIDVKSSALQVSKTTTDQSREGGLSKYGVVVLHSHITDEELDGYFFIDQNLSQSKAERIGPIVKALSNKHLSKRVNF